MIHSCEENEEMRGYEMRGKKQGQQEQDRKFTGVLTGERCRKKKNNMQSESAGKLGHYWKKGMQSKENNHRLK